METEISENRAAAYTRVSPDSQQSVMAQLETIRRIAVEHGLSMARAFSPSGEQRMGELRLGDDAFTE